MTVSGLLNLRKPVGPTSSQMVVWLRRLSGEQKIGHTGTLDPLAGGVLPICVGKAVRLSEYLLNDDKAYQAEVTFGVRTRTDDGEGEIIARQPATFARAELAATLERFVGEQMQTPPQYAAIKVAGQPLYKRARRGEVVEPAPRHIKITRLQLLDWRVDGDNIRAQIEIACGKGTYIRALARDLGQALGCGAYLSALTRTQCGVFKLSDAVAPETLEQAADWRAHLLPMDAGLQHWPAVALAAAEAQRIRTGLCVSCNEPCTATTLLRAYDERAQFFAILRCEAAAQRFCPEKVFLDAYSIPGSPDFDVERSQAS